MNAVFAAALAGAGFSGASLLALLGGQVSRKAQAYLFAVAAGVIVALAFGDLFPESLEMAGSGAVACFIGGFALLLLLESFFHRHDHPELRVGETALAPFVIGFALHNLAEGFVVAVGAGTSVIAAGGIGLGVLLHKIPEGGSLAAVMAGSRVTRIKVAATAVLLGLVLPAAAFATLTFSAPGKETLGLMSGMAGGVLAYLGTSHLLPEARARHPQGAAATFAVALLATGLALLTVLSG